MLTKKKAVKLEQRIEKDEKIADMVKDIEEEFNEDIIDQYHKLASELGYSTPQIVREKLLKFLKKNNLKIYDRLKVETFLDGQYGEKVDASQEFLPNGGNKRPGWCWVGITDKQGKVVELRKPSEETVAIKNTDLPMTNSVITTAPSLVWDIGDFSTNTWVVSSPSSGYSGDIDTTNRTYKNEIPMRILELISKVKQEIPELSFFVSDVALPKPDPFLYVTCEGMQGLILAHWNEPSFVD